MSKALLIMGESGSGKTTSCRNLDPETTYYIDCDKKGLSWRGWRDNYSAENRNYACTDRPEVVQRLVANVAEKAPHVKNVVIDTINGIMVADEMRRIREKGYDKWVDLASCVWALIDTAYSYRDDLTIIFLAHSQTERDDNGYTFTRVKTNGRKLDKIVLESKFTVVLLSKCVDGKYLFEVHANNSTVKSPLGMFDSNEIPNDITKVLGAMEEY